MNFHELFKVKKPIIGMLHLAGSSRQEKIDICMEELRIYEEEGVDGVIFENYHGSEFDVQNALSHARNLETKLVKGVNILGNPLKGFDLADEFNCKFVQFDSIHTQDLDLAEYKLLRESYLNIAVLGGVWFKYVRPTGNSLEQDLREAVQKCDAIVTTGAGTGIGTPIEKLREFRKHLVNFPLIIGAGLNHRNAYEKLPLSDGAIAGSCFKPNYDTSKKADRYVVRDMMCIIKDIRKTCQ